MAEKLNCTRVGLTVGVFAGALHALWAVAVALGVGDNVMSAIMPLHFIDMACKVLPFNFLTAVLLIIAATAGGYLMGWLFAALWNAFGKCCK